MTGDLLIFWYNVELITPQILTKLLIAIGMRYFRSISRPFVVSQEALPLLEKSNSASIINIGSVSGQYGGPRTAHYAASKAGLISLSQVIARFCADKNIRSNTISAGLIASDIPRRA